MGLFSSNESFIGVDIGSSSIKVVELTKVKGQAKLLNYSFSEDPDLRNDWQNDTKFTAKLLNKVCSNAGIQPTKAIAALPTFSVFSSVLNLSNVAKKDLEGAVTWEAKKVIPLPPEEMILDWKIIEKSSTKENIKVLLTGAPKTLVKKYIDVFKQAKISLTSLETETFSLIRSLVGNDKSTVMILEIGHKTTDISIIDDGIPLLNRSVDVGGQAITLSLSKKLGVNFSRAEQFKYDLGITSQGSKEHDIPDVIRDSLAPILNEIKYAINLYQNRDDKKVGKIILSGGSTLLVNLPNYLSKALNMTVIIGDPWTRISYPPSLKPLLQEIGPRMSVAIGLALRGIKK